MTNLDAKGAKRSVKMFSTIFYISFFKYMNGRLSKIRLVHTYVIPRTVYFDWICIQILTTSFVQNSLYLVTRCPNVDHCIEWRLAWSIGHVEFDRFVMNSIIFDPVHENVKKQIRALKVRLKRWLQKEIWNSFEMCLLHSTKAELLHCASNE